MCMLSCFTLGQITILATESELANLFFVFIFTAGTEALFADVGHFSVRSIQISMCSMVYPAIVLAYFGQASYLRKHMGDVSQAFYASIPGLVYLFEKRTTLICMFSDICRFI